MNTKIALYGFIIVLGVINIVMNGWVYLLEGETRFLLWVGLGLLFIIAGAMNIRRELQARGPR